MQPRNTHTPKRLLGHPGMEDSAISCDQAEGLQIRLEFSDSGKKRNESLQVPYGLGLLLTAEVFEILAGTPTIAEDFVRNFASSRSIELMRQFVNDYDAYVAANPSHQDNR